jgi:hypothetical protein
MRGRGFMMRLCRLRASSKVLSRVVILLMCIGNLLHTREPRCRKETKGLPRGTLGLLIGVLAYIVAILLPSFFCVREGASLLPLRMSRAIMFVMWWKRANGHVLNSFDV